MAISRIGIGTRTEIASGNLVTGALPAGWAQDDLAILRTTKKGSSGTFALPAGWTGLCGTPPSASTGGGIACYLLAYRKLITGDTTWTITDDGTNGKSASIVVYRGQDLTTPIDVEGVFTHSASGPAPTITGAGITIVTQNAALIFMGGLGDDYSVAFLPATSMTEVYDYETTIGTDQSGFHDEQLLMATGATGDKTKASAPTGTTIGSGALFAIRPAVAAGGLSLPLKHSARKSLQRR